MCGIVGLVAKNTTGLIKQHEDTFFDMLYADAVRGYDSTGVIGVENDTTFRIAKEATSAEWFIHQLKTAPAKEINIINPTYNRGKVWIGHNRKKTYGEIKDETAHPFVVDNTFAMVHNGTLINHNDLAKGCAVDSEALAIHLKKAFDEGGSDEKKLKEALEEALGKVNGAYALAMYDQKQHKVHLLRNAERPLFIIEVDNGWYFMSEALMGAWCLVRNNYKYDNLKCDPLKVHEMVTFDLDSTKMSRMELSPKKSRSPSNNSQFWGGMGNTGTTTGTGTGTKTTRITATQADRTNVKFCKTEKELKKFRKSWLGSRIAFWPDDFLEKNFPRTIDEDGETDVVIMGGHEDIVYAHTVNAEVDLSKLKIRYSEDITNKKWTGVVDSVDVTKEGVVQVWVKDCKPMMPSIVSQVKTAINNAIADVTAKSAVNDAVSFNAKEAQVWRVGIERMLLEDLEDFYQKNHKRWHNWQVTACNCEIAFRKGITGVEQAAQIARNRDNCILEQKTINGKFVYVNNDGRIYYETAIVVH